jgi:hypothetical protein
MACPNCGFHAERPAVKPEPAIGTWVKDRFGGVHVRVTDGGWAASPSTRGFARWEPMWEARGPLVECGAWGAPLP